MSGVRKNHSAAFKAKVALEAIKQNKTIAQLSGEYGVHSNQISRWKQHLVRELLGIFKGKLKAKEKKAKELQTELYRQIGQLKVELDWVKKNLNSFVEAKKRCVEPDHPEISINRQCELLCLSKSSYYYKQREVNSYNKLLMRLIDEEYTRHPFYGTRRLTAWLKRKGHEVNIKRVRRLMRDMGIEAIYQKPNFSKAFPEHKKYPYLLKNIVIDHPDQVWSSDITYIRMKHGFIYLTAVMDWFSRYVLSFEVSTTLDTGFCIEALEKALNISKPEIFNTDQGSQFTSEAFTGCLKSNGITISMDGKGRAFDNIFVERLWRSVKYEEVYLNDYETVKNAIVGLFRYFEFYNKERVHQALEYQTPYEVYAKK